MLILSVLPEHERKLYEQIEKWEAMTFLENLQLSALLDAWPSPTLAFCHGLD